MGCSGQSGPKVSLAPAAGVVQFDGKPVTDATVTFYPDDGPAGIGRTDASGAFQIKTNGQLGAVVGSHHVTVAGTEGSGEAPQMDGNEMQFADKARYSAKYMDPETTDLVVTIDSAGNKELVLDLTE